MKKLLALMSAVVITGATTVTAVACTKNDNDQHKDENGNSIWAWLPGLSNNPVNSADVWNNLADPLQPNKGGNSWTTDPNQWDGPTRLKMASQLTRILSVSILVNADTLISDDDQKELNKIADYKDLKPILKQQWDALKLSVDTAVQNKKDQLKQQYQKKWEDEYHKFLDKNYPDITGKKGNEKYEIEEKNYRASLMVNGGDNVTSATQLLTNVLLTNKMRRYNSDGLSAISPILMNFNEFLKTGKPVNEWDASNSDKQTLALAYSYDTATNTYKGIKDTNFISSRLQYIANELENVNYSVEEFSKTHMAYPAPKLKTAESGAAIDPSTLNLSSSSIDPAQLSMFQRYMLSQWFVNEKPLAISQVTYKYKDGVKPFTKAISSDYFDKDVVADIQEDLGLLKGGSSWNNFYQFKSKSGTASSEQKLITLSNNDDAAKSTFLKANVYNLANDAITTNNNVDNDLSDLISKTNRKDDTTLAAKYYINNNKDKVSIFFDDDGLHIVHIDGYQFLKDSGQLSYNFDSEWQLNKLGYSNNIFQDAVKKNVDTQINDSAILNDQFNSTPYLKYLVNMSVSSKLNGNSRYKFDVFDEMANYAKLDKDTDPTKSSIWWTWIYDFFNDLFRNKAIGLNKKNWLDELLKFQNDPNSNSESSSLWYTSILGSVTSVLKGGAKNNFTNKIVQTNTKITENNTDGTDGQINIDDSNQGILNFINSSKFWIIESNNTQGGGN